MALVLRELVSVSRLALHQNCSRFCLPRFASSILSEQKENDGYCQTTLLKGKESPEEIDDGKIVARHVISKVNQQIENKVHGRLFAIIYLSGKQFKVTAEDIVVVQGHWPPNVGDKLNLRKILLVGCSDFTLVGRPVLPNAMVKVEATVVEKTLSHTIPTFHKKRRKQFMRINFFRSQLTYVKINSIEISESVNTKKVKDVQGSIF